MSFFSKNIWIQIKFIINLKREDNDQNVTTVAEEPENLTHQTQIDFAGAGKIQAAGHQKAGEMKQRRMMKLKKQKKKVRRNKMIAKTIKKVTALKQSDESVFEVEAFAQASSWVDSATTVNNQSNPGNLET